MCRRESKETLLLAGSGYSYALVALNNGRLLLAGRYGHLFLLNSR